MASRWAGISDRIRFSPQVRGLTGWAVRPIGVTSGRWIAVGPVWVGSDMAYGFGAASWGARTQDNCYHLSWATLS